MWLCQWEKFVGKIDIAFSELVDKLLVRKTENVCSRVACISHVFAKGVTHRDENWFHCIKNQKMSGVEIIGMWQHWFILASNRPPPPLLQVLVLKYGNCVWRHQRLSLELNAEKMLGFRLSPLASSDIDNRYHRYTSTLLFVLVVALVKHCPMCSYNGICSMPVLK